jgi:hypothetical protein
VTARRQIAEDRAKLNPEQVTIDKFLNREWIALSSGDKAKDA